MAPTQFKLSVGALVSNSLGIYFRNLIPFVVLGAIVLAPWILLRLTLMEDPQVVWAPAAGLLLQSVLGFVLTGALTFGVVQQLRGEPAGIAAALSTGLQSFGRVLGTAFMCGIRILLWSLVLYIPGIIESIRLFVAIPAAVMEGKGASASIERSVRLTDGSRWPIFGAWFLTMLIGWGLVFVCVFLLTSSTGSFEDAANHAWIDIGVALLVTPFSATMGSSAYFLLRKGRENVDAKQIAAVFD